jgi:hypothetical protein
MQGEIVDNFAGKNTLFVPTKEAGRGSLVMVPGEEVTKN